MNKTILIPTDFTVKSLGLVRRALEKNEESVNIVLAHGILLSTSITDLLFISKRKLVEPLLSKEFQDAIQMLNSKYGSQINRISIEVYTGRTISAFKNFLEGNKVDEAYISPGYIPSFKHKYSFDLLTFIKRSGLPFHEFPLVATAVKKTEEHETVADLFFSHIQPSLNK